MGKTNSDTKKSNNMQGASKMENAIQGRSLKYKSISRAERRSGKKMPSSFAEYFTLKLKK